MLRYHPSLNFSPSLGSPQGTTVVPHNPEGFAIARQTTSRRVDVRIGPAYDGKTSDMQSPLKSLLEFALWSNECERATISLEVFLRQVHEGRAEAEKVLEKHTAAAATRFAQSLLDTIPELGSRASEKEHGDSKAASPKQCRREPVSTSTGVPNMTQQGDERSTMRSPPSPKSAVAFQIRERLRTFQEGEEVLKVDKNVKQIRKEVQRAYRAFAGTASRTEKGYKMELVLRPLLTSSWSIQSQQSILRRTLRTKLELIRDRDLGMWSSKAMEGLTKIIEGELRDVVGSTKTKNLYSVEVLLHPCGVGAVVPQNHSAIRVASQQQEGYDNEAQRSPISYQTRVLFTDAGTQTLPGLLQAFKQESTRITGNHEVVCGCKPVTSGSPLQEKVEVQLLSPDPESSLDPSTRASRRGQRPRSHSVEYVSASTSNRIRARSSPGERNS